MVHIGNDWDEILKGEFDKEYYRCLRRVLVNEYRTQTVFPPPECIFNALKLTPYSEVKVVILGQDPYHEPNQAHGLAFSVLPGVKIPPSLLNIYKELQSELGCYIPNNGFLEKWARQGVLLLNATLTVREAQANSHSRLGWDIFTDTVVRHINEREDPAVFLLWGANAKKKQEMITSPRHTILTSAHPSPLSASRGFFGCGHFKETNRILHSWGKSGIDWQIENIQTAD